MFTFSAYCTVFIAFLIHIFDTEAYNIDISMSELITAPKGTKEAYFGYSLQWLLKDGKYSFLVGAPRWKNSDLISTGAVFSCPYSYNVPPLTTPCQRITFQDKINKPTAKNSWFGVTLAVGEDNRFIACGHKWQNFNLVRVVKIPLIQGECVEMYENGTTQVYQPMRTRRKKITDQINTKSTFNVHPRAFGQVGLSAIYIKDKEVTRILLGAPGLNDARGGVALLSDNNKRVTLWSIVKPEDTDEYTGYSLAAGKFWSLKNYYYAVGSPRGHKGYGMVYINNFDTVITKLFGHQFGSYFGAAICAANVNGNSHDDILVGAPFYSKTQEEGRVYVYTTRAYEGTFMSSVDELYGSNLPRSRFGSAIADIGDINKDKINDIAVGAPFEESGAGAVYIYLGSSRGVREPFSQKIQASHVDVGLRSFGTSFSKSADFDNNDYLDFAVGAPLSDNIAILRTRPIGTITGSLQFDRSTIRHDERTCYHNATPYTCLKMTGSLTYDASKLAKPITIKYTLQADSHPNHEVERSRAKFLLLSQETTSNITQEGTLSVGGKIQINNDVLIRAERDVFTDVKFTLSYEIVKECLGVERRFCPILPSNAQHNFTSSIVFLKDCKSGTCIADLEVDMINTKGENPLVIGRDKTITIKITITNRGDDAYLAQTYLIFPSFIMATKVTTLQAAENVKCTVKRKTSAPLSTLECRIGNPLKSLFTTSMLVEFTLKEVEVYVENATISANTSTISSVGNTLEQKYAGSVNVEIRRQVNVATNSFSRPEQIWLGLPNNNSAPESLVKVTQYMHITNTGYSDISDSTLIVYVPTHPFNNHTLFNLHSVQLLDEKHGVDVNCDFSLFTSDTSVSYLKSDASQQSMDCAVSLCHLAVCHTNNIHPGNTITLVISGKLNKSSLSLSKVETFMSLRSMVIHTLSNSTLFTPDSIHHTSIYYIKTDIFRYRSASSGFTWWALVLGIGIGILLIATLVFLLNKLGFFRRKIQEEMRTLAVSRQRYHTQHNIDNDGSAQNHAVVPETEVHENAEYENCTLSPIEPNEDNAVHNRLYSNINRPYNYHVTAV